MEKSMNNEWSYDLTVFSTDQGAAWARKDSAETGVGETAAALPDHAWQVCGGPGQAFWAGGQVGEGGEQLHLQPAAVGGHVC